MDDLLNWGTGAADNIMGAKSKSDGSAPNMNLQSNTNNNMNTTENKEKERKIATYKVVIVGDAGVGKTSFLNKHLNGKFDIKYKASMGAKQFDLTFNTNLDEIRFTVFDVAGQSLFAGKRDQYYKGINGAIIMYDVMNWASYDNVCDIWLKELLERAPKNIPICICGNKMENRDLRRVSVEVVAEAISSKFEKKGIGYCEISAKNGQNLAEPFLFLTKKLLNINDSKALYFVSRISELNLIESMLKHKENKQSKSVSATASLDANTTQSIDNLFSTASATNNNTKKNENSKNKTNGDYLDDIFMIGDDVKTVKNKKSSDDNKSNDIDHDNDYLEKLMSAPTTKTTKSPKSSKSPKSKSNKITTSSMSPKSNIKIKTKQTVKPKPKIQQQAQLRNSHNVNSKNKKKQSNVMDNSNDTNVVIDILFSLQEAMNNLQKDVKLLQRDVKFLKESQLKSQRR